MSEDLSALSMKELFQMEAEAQYTALSDTLIGFANAANRKEALESMMRAAHSIKGAARIVHEEDAVRIAHALEEVFMRAQAGTIQLDAHAVDALLSGSDFLLAIGQGRTPDPAGVNSLLEACRALESGTPLPAPASPQTAAEPASTATEQSLRVDASRLDRILGLAGEGSVAARQLERLAASARSLSALTTRVAKLAGRENAELVEAVSELQTELARRSTALDAFARSSSRQAEMLYDEVLASRMRPFSSCLPPLRRLVHDLARTLDKQVKLEVVGEDTPVDREILEKLESPLTHLVRNSLDHGIEPPRERAAAGKPESGKIRIDARHLAGNLVITLTDDGRGIDLDALRERVIARGHASRETAESMSDAELVDFIFLPGFSSRDEVTELSGRGFGLDVVQTISRSLRGSVRALTHLDAGFGFELRLPISLSVLRSLIVTIAGEPFAFPLAHVERVLRLPFSSVESTEGRQYFRWDDQLLPLASGAQILGLPPSSASSEMLNVLILRDRENSHGILVDGFLTEQDLVIQPLDAHFGKIPGIAAASILNDGAPVLIVDTDDFTTAMERLARTGSLQAVEMHDSRADIDRRRILVADDSLTVRELERKLLTAGGYDVTVAVDGMDAWNALRSGTFDLVLTDVDMPRMDGIELTRLIKADARLARVPVMIVSYKDRPEDQRRGLEAGADYYLTKGAFQDDGLLSAVADLLGDER